MDISSRLLGVALAGKCADQVQLGAIRLAPLPLVVFSLGLVNCLGVSSFNNWIIALLQFCFVAYTLLLFSRDACRVSTWIPVLCFIACPLVVSNFLVAGDMDAWKRLFGVLMHLCFGVAIAVWVLKVPAALRLVAGAVLLAVSLYFLVLAGAWMALDDPRGYDWFYNPPLFRHIRHLGYFLCIGSAVAAWALFTSGGVRRLLSGAVFCIATGMLLWSGSRGAFLALMVGLGVLACHRSLRRDISAWIIIICALLMALWLSALFQVNHGGLGWLAAVQRSSDAGSLDQLSSSRIAIWQYLIPKIQERFWFGWGGEGFKAVWEGYPLVQAHNGILQLLIEWGVVGTLAIGMVLASVFGLGFKAFYMASCPLLKVPALSLGLLLAACLLSLSLIDGVFYHGTPFAFLMIGFGLTLAALRIRPQTVSGAG